MSKVILNGDLLDFETCVNLMDDEIREKLHRELAPCSEQKFIDSYVIEHEKIFGEKFEI